MDDDLIFRSAGAQLDGLRRREFSARELLMAHVAQIDRVNPAVNAVVTLDGTPVCCTDTHATAGVRTTLGSPLHVHWVPEHDDEIVRRVRAPGAVRLSKTWTATCARRGPARPSATAHSGCGASFACARSRGPSAARSSTPRARSSVT
jgi:Asp-tRNA(Asn)/Glu-tRNA(Gln) amidotransferase A subunit family amidase